MQAGALLLAAWPPAARLLHASDADAIAVSMCAGTKTVALGIPIIQAVYEHNPAAGLLSLPLIIYHAEQILLGSLITAPLKRWVTRRAKQAEASAAQEARGAQNGHGDAELGAAGVESSGAVANGGASAPPDSEETRPPQQQS